MAQTKRIITTCNTVQGSKKRREYLTETNANTMTACKVHTEHLQLEIKPEYLDSKYCTTMQPQSSYTKTNAWGTHSNISRNWIKSLWGKIQLSTMPLFPKTNTHCSSMPLEQWVFVFEDIAGFWKNGFLVQRGMLWTTGGLQNNRLYPLPGLSVHLKIECPPASMAFAPYSVRSSK